MKSMFLDRSKDFFEILYHEKGEWADFYFKYVKNAPHAFGAYHGILGMDVEKIKRRISTFERRTLDKCYQSILQLSPYEYESARLVVNYAKKDKLDLSKFRVYVVGALDFESVYVINKLELFVDVLALFRVGFSELPKLISQKLKEMG